MPVRAKKTRQKKNFRAFSSEVGTGSGEENASKENECPIGSDLIRTDQF
jgi:hypothetical protein